MVLESVNIKDTCTEGGEELVFRELDQRFPDMVAADRMGEAMEEAFGLKIMTRLVFTRRQSEGADLPSEARGYIVLRGCRPGSLGRATVMSATRRNWEVDDVCMAIPTSFPGCPPDRWSHGTFGLEELEDSIEEDHVEFGDDAEHESEIDAILGALEAIESDAIEVLATWKQIRTPWPKKSSIGD